MYDNSIIPRIEPKSYRERTCPCCGELFVTTYQGICNHHASCWRTTHMWGVPHIQASEIIAILQDGPRRFWCEHTGIIAKLGLTRSPAVYHRIRPILSSLRSLGLIEYDRTTRCWSIVGWEPGVDRAERVKRAARHMEIARDELFTFEYTGSEPSLLAAEAHQAMADQLLRGR